MKQNQADFTRRINFSRHFNALVIILASLYFFICPGLTVIHQLTDVNIRTAGIPRSAWELHRNLSPIYERWARERLDSKRATALTINDISGTEWPLFGSAFFLWATESLQDAWDKDHSLSPVAPNVYAKAAIEAATKLVIDPAQANWVQTHWGKKYLHTENVFYRMLVISALTSHARLTGEKQYLPMLRDQADSMADELDASRHGLLDDYPGECYPGDVLAAIAMIHKADGVLGTDHSVFVQRAIRGFQKKAADPKGLVSYAADSNAGTPDGPTRGCGNSYVALFSPGVWPAQAHNWYDLYTRYFWQESGTCAGFREFPNDWTGNNWYADVDSGLVMGGYGCAACAFGVGAARVNGHFEHAYPLTAEMLVTSWPLPNGTRLLPRFFSNATDAPYLGEAAILYNLTRMPADGVVVKTGGSLPIFVLIFLCCQLGWGLLILFAAFRSLRFWRKNRESLFVVAPQLQFGMWLSLLLAGVVCLLCGQTIAALLLLLGSQLFPRFRRPRPSPAIVKEA